MLRLFTVSVAGGLVLAGACTGGQEPDGGDGGAQSGASTMFTTQVSSATSGGMGLLPLNGGPNIYGQFVNGPSSEQTYFPISVWLQSPSSAADYEAIGINTFVGLYDGPDEQMLADLSRAGMRVACDQNAVGQNHLFDPTILAWTQQDEPDNAQPLDGGGYGPCISAQEMEARWEAIKAIDTTRPVFLNLGQGVANQHYIGWGSECSATHPGDYPQYLMGADIISFDIYPDNSDDEAIRGNLYYVAQGVQHLADWSQGTKAVWNWIETTGIDDPSGKPSTDDVKAEVWMSIVHGSMGIGYFAHQIGPTFNEHALLDDPEMKAAVLAINEQITELAPVLNLNTVLNAATVGSSDPDVPVDMAVKFDGAVTYVIAVGMRRKATTATFAGLATVPAGATVDVLGEDREISIVDGSFSDDFAPYGVHIYRIE